MTRTHSLRLLGGIAVSLAVGAALFAIRREGGGPAASHATRTSVSEAGSQPPLLSTGARNMPSLVMPKVGSQRAYDVELLQEVRISKQGPGVSATGREPDSVPQTQGLRLQYAVLCVGATDARVRYRGVLSKVELSVGGQPSVGHPAAKDFERPFFFETDREGRLSSVAFDKSANADARRFVRALVSGTQVVVRQEPGWSVREEDSTGQYEARYDRDLEHPRMIRKARQRYTRVVSDRGLVPVEGDLTMALDDDTRIDLGGEGALDSIVSKTRTDMHLGPQMPRVSSRLFISMRLRQASMAPIDVVRWGDEWAAADQSLLTDAPASEPWDGGHGQQGNESQASAPTLDELFSQLRALAGDSNRQRAEVIQRLSNHFRARPEDASKARAYVRTASVADGQSIAAALDGASTPESLRALAEIAKDTEVSKAVRMNSIAVLATNPTPSPGSVQALKAMGGDSDPDIQGAATLALGGAARALKEADPAAYGDAVATLLARMGAAQSPDDKARLLRALGNAGDPRVLPLAVRAMNGEPVVVRMAAVTAVRFLKGPDADVFLASVMKREADASVRIQAVQTVEEYREVPEYFPVFAEMLSQDSFEMVRRAVLHALNSLRTNAAARLLVEASAKNDPSPEVRAYALGILEAARQP